jgi:hypothetical protein
MRKKSKICWPVEEIRNNKKSKKKAKKKRKGWRGAKANR